MRIGAKYRGKMVPAGSPGLRKSIKNRSWERPGAARSVQGRSGATPARPGVVTERPGSDRGTSKNVHGKKEEIFWVPKNIRKRPGTIKIHADSPPGAKKSKVFSQKPLFLYAVAARTRSTTILYQFLSVLSFFRKTCESSKVLCLSAKIGVRPCTQRVTSLVQMTTKKTRKSTQNRVKIDKNRSPDLFGPPFWRTFGRNSRKN